MNPVYDFSGQVALLTGASSGMGLAPAQGFAQSGAAVALIDRNVEAVEEATRALVAAGHKAIDIACDVSEEVQAVNLRGIRTFMKHDLRQMKKQGSGAIVNCATLGGCVGLCRAALPRADR